jgi:hypothetical protein
MCSKCSHAFVRAKLRRVMVGLLLTVFFSLMVIDIFTPDEPEVEVCLIEPTDTNVETLDPPEDIPCNDPHGYFCDNLASVTF